MGAPNTGTRSPGAAFFSGRPPTPAATAAGAVTTAVASAPLACACPWVEGAATSPPPHDFPRLVTPPQPPAQRRWADCFGGPRQGARDQVLAWQSACVMIERGVGSGGPAGRRQIPTRPPLPAGPRAWRPAKHVRKHLKPIRVKGDRPAAWTIGIQLPQLPFAFFCGFQRPHPPAPALYKLGS